MIRRILSCLFPFLLAGCFNGLLLTPVNTNSPVEEVVITESKHPLLCHDKIAIIDVDGVIMNAKSSGLLGEGENMMSTFRERLDAAAEDKHVKAVVLRINSPGGAVTASDIMYHDLLTFRRDTGKPVVACMMDVAASGGCYLAMGADHIIAHSTTITGSIGVIMSLYNATGLFEKVGVTSNPIKSGPIKDIGNPARPMTEEEHAILQKLVNSFYDQFVHVVASSRRLPEDEVRHFADGRVFSGIEAKKIGLIDEVGYLEDAIATAKSMACLKEASVVAYDRCSGYRGSIYAGMPSIPSEVKIKLDVPLFNNKGGAAFMYLWEPAGK
jgi:protease IV